MEIIFEILKEFKQFPIIEIESCLKSENIRYKILEENNNLFLIYLDDKYYYNIKKIANRLSLTYYVGELLFISSNDLNEITKSAKKLKIKNNGSIAIKYKNRSKNIDSQKILKILADILTINKKVKLTNPDIEIRFLLTDNYVYVYKKIIEIDRSQFENRKAHFRPFFSPISLHPKLSRLMVNFSRIKKNDILLDPFCGTGGILIEAGLMGYKIIGNDVENTIVKGCKKNLDFYNIKDYKLLNFDVGELYNYLSNIDVIVTDFPYGRSTTTKGESLNDLYNKAFYNINKILKNHGLAIVGLNSLDFIDIGKNYLNLINYYSIKIHRSLTRYITIYKKN